MADNATAARVIKGSRGPSNQNPGIKVDVTAGNGRQNFKEEVLKNDGQNNVQRPHRNVLEPKHILPQGAGPTPMRNAMNHPTQRLFRRTQIHIERLSGGRTRIHIKTSLVRYYRMVSGARKLNRPNTVMLGNKQ